MVDSCCIFHAENDAVDRFSLSPHIVELWFLGNQMEHQPKFDSSIWVSIWLQRKQNSTIWGDSEKRSTASFSAWKIQQESTIRTLENFNLFFVALWKFNAVHFDRLKLKCHKQYYNSILYCINLLCNSNRDFLSWPTAQN